MVAQSRGRCGWAWHPARTSVLARGVHGRRMRRRERRRQRVWDCGGGAQAVRLRRLFFPVAALSRREVASTRARTAATRALPPLRRRRLSRSCEAFCVASEARDTHGLGRRGPLTLHFDGPTACRDSRPTACSGSVNRSFTQYSPHSAYDRSSSAPRAVHPAHQLGQSTRGASSERHALAVMEAPPLHTGAAAAATGAGERDLQRTAPRRMPSGGGAWARTAPWAWQLRPPPRELPTNPRRAAGRPSPRAAVTTGAHGAALRLAAEASSLHVPGEMIEQLAGRRRAAALAGVHAAPTLHSPSPLASHPLASHLSPPTTCQIWQLGELNSIFTAITDSIAWGMLSRAPSAASSAKTSSSPRSSATF